MNERKIGIFTHCVPQMAHNKKLRVAIKSSPFVKLTVR